MRVILEIRTGPQAGRKIWLKRGQTIQVGSTEDADFAVADDLDMAGLHFSLHTDQQGCFLTDLETESGTLVNGEKIRSAQLNDGDQVQAGHTILLVSIDGARPSDGEAAATRATPSPETSRSQATSPPPPPGEGIPCVEDRCGSGLTMFESAAADSPASVVARQLAERSQAYVLADLTKLKKPYPADAGEPCYLLDWLVPEAQEENSPVLLSQENTPELFALVDEGWGQDGLVCLFSSLGWDDMLAQLRAASAYNPTTGVQAERETMLAFWWPNIFRLVLTHSPPANVRQLLGEIEAVLLESPDGQKWQLFGRPALMDKLRQTRWLAVSDPARGEEAADEEASAETADDEHPVEKSE